jgi:hypothetical protein
MEHLEDAGKSWRESIGPQLNNIGINYISPNDLETMFASEYPDRYSSLHEVKSDNLELFNKLFDRVKRIDLTTVCLSDLVIVNWHGEKSAGTISEVDLAWLQDIPRFLITDRPNSEIMSWFLASFTQVFSSVYECIDYLKEHGYNK